MAKDLNIVFTDFWSGWSPEYDFISPILETKYNLVRNESNPDIVFCSSLHRMKNTLKYRQPKIMYTGENHKTSSYDVDYSISFDPHSETNYHLPLWQLECMRHPQFMERLDNRIEIDFKKSRFCAYTVRNPKFKERNDIFTELCKVGGVDSYGKHNHNKDGMLPMEHDNKLKFLTANPHKFSVAYESGIREGYCTEKILHSFLIGGIPIYKGDPSVDTQFNDRAFINGNGITEKEIAEYVGFLGNNPAEYYKIANEEVFLPEQKTAMFNNIKGLSDWLLNVVNNIMQK